MIFTSGYSLTGVQADAPRRGSHIEIRSLCLFAVLIFPLSGYAQNSGSEAATSQADTMAFEEQYLRYELLRLNSESIKEVGKYDSSYAVYQTGERPVMAFEPLYANPF